MNRNMNALFQGRALTPQDLKKVKGGVNSGMSSCCITCPNGQGGTEEYCQNCGIGNDCGQEQTTATSGIIVCYDGSGPNAQEDMIFNCPKSNPPA